MACNLVSFHCECSTIHSSKKKKIWKNMVLEEFIKAKTHFPEKKGYFSDIFFIAFSAQGVKASQITN